MTQIRTLHPVLLTFLLLALPAAAAAQVRPAVLQGQVLSAGNGDAMAGILLRFDSGQETLTDGEGRFLVEALAPGTHEVVLVTPDCRVSGAEVEVAPGTLHRVELFLPATIAARAPAGDRERPQSSDALVLTGPELTEMHLPTLTEVVRRVVPSMVGNAGGRVGGHARLQSRSINSLLDRNPPVVVVDGVRVTDGAEILGLLRPSEVERLEILRGAAAGWEFGSSGSAGAILVTTRSGDVASSSGGTRIPVRGVRDARLCPVPDGIRGP